MTPDEIERLEGLADALDDGTYCPDPSPFHAELLRKAAHIAREFNKAFVTLGQLKK